MAHVLLVEDSPDYHFIIRKVLDVPALRLSVATTVAEATQVVRDSTVDLIILDVALPDGDGFEFCGRLREREQTRDIPVLFLTGKSDVTAKVTAFSLGADDYMVKPFHPLELKARVEAKLKKLKEQQARAGCIRKGRLRFDLPIQRAYWADSETERELHLTPREFKILYFLARNEDRVVTRQQILDEVWGKGEEVFDRTVDTHISAIRRKLGPDGSTYIASVMGSGYRFCVPRKPAAAGA